MKPNVWFEEQQRLSLQGPDAVRLIAPTQLLVVQQVFMYGAKGYRQVTAVRQDINGNYTCIMERK